MHRKHNFKRTYPDAQAPSKKRYGDAGWDLYAHDDYVIEPGEVIDLDCGVAVWIPEEYVGLIVPRGSWRQKGLVCHAIYDHGFTGNITPSVVNASNLSYEIKKGERVLQLLFVRVSLDGEMQEVDEFPITDRGDDELGSTGRF